MITITTDNNSYTILTCFPNKDKKNEIKGEMNNSSYSPIKLLNKEKHQVDRAI